MRLMEREDFRMKENKMSRRSFLKAGAFASAAGMLAAAPAAANAAAPNAAKAAEEENGLLGVFGGKPKYVFLFIGDGMGTAQIQSARFYKGTVENNGAVVEGELSFTQFPEVGSMAIGYKTTNYDTFLTNLTHQKMSYAKFDSTYVEGYIANKTPFEAAMADVKANFGLTLPTDPDAASAGKLLLTDYEVENLRKAYERTLEVGASSQKEMSQQDYELYGTYIPFSMAICHTINHKSGMDHTTYAHTGAMVNIYALGAGAEKFRGVFDNTEIYHKLAELTGVQ